MAVPPSIELLERKRQRHPDSVPVALRCPPDLIFPLKFELCMATTCTFHELELSARSMVAAKVGEVVENIELFIDDKLPKAKSLYTMFMGEVYDLHKDSDGWLYLFCSDGNNLTKKRKREDYQEASTAAWRSLWELRQFADVTIQCGSMCFELHRVVLAAHSPVFNAMLTNEKMVEGATRRITVEDTQPESLELMFQYMYIGELPANCDFCALLTLADRYDVTGLDHLCADSILQAISAETVATSLRALKKHKHRKPVDDAYSALLAKIQKDQQLFEAMAEAV